EGAAERGRGLGRDGRLVRRRVARWEGRQHALADRVGASRTPRRGRPAVDRSRPRHRLAGPDAGAGRDGGRAALHRDGISASLLPPLPPLPALLPAHGARPLRPPQWREGMTVGIERLAVYVPQYALRLADLAVARGVPPEKLTSGLGVREMA